MISSVPPSLSRLFELSKTISTDSRGDKMSSFGEIGLYLSPNLDYQPYASTPSNSATFASTGGDGVHFGFLFGSEFDKVEPPIVMTVPMNFDLPNVIVGNDLEEFLSLGCRTGYFSLEQIVYDPKNTILELQTGKFYPDTTEDEVKLLNLISAKFGSKPWRQPEERLEQLRSQYHALLEFQDSGVGTA